MQKIISFDLESGDFGINSSYKAAIKFLKENPSYKITGFVKNETDIPSDCPKNLKIIKTKELIQQSDGALELARKKDSTLIQSIDLVVKNKANAIVSAAPSSALVLASYLYSKPINKDTKPAFAPMVMGVDGKLKICTDMGANLGATAEQLEKYAIMSSVFSKLMNISSKPKVALLNIGTEKTKGTKLLKDTYSLLEKNKKINFLGNIEASEILETDANVILAEALSGNFALKSWEGALKLIQTLTKKAIKNSFSAKLGLVIAKKGLKKEFENILNTRTLGGAILIGLNHIVVKAHGFSDETMFLNSLNTAKKLIEKDFIKKLKEAI